MGYTPLFDSLTKGTLCGRWPDIGLWPIVLSMADKNGIVDVTPAYISSVSGLPLDDVVACMTRFCQPDPHSRSKDAGGARLTLMDSHREWGWVVVNHARYREKARKASHDAARIDSGENAKRMQARRSRLHDDPTRPDATREHPLSNSNTNTNKEEEKRADALPPELDKQAWEIWLAYRAEIKKPIKPASMAAAQRKLAGFHADQAAVVEQSIAQGWTGLFAMKHEGDRHAPGGRKPTRLEQSQRELER